MHEYSIASSILRMAEEQAAKHAAARVLSLELRIGALSGVEIDLLETAWSLVRERSCCDGAELRVTRVEALFACPRCGVAMAPGALLRCAECGVPARLASGDELVLERVEMEVD